MAVFTEETQKKILAAMKETTALTKIIANGWNVDSWKAVQTIVQAGAGEKYFPIGTQLNVASTTYGTLVFDVVAHNHHKNPNNANAPTMTLLQHDVIYGRQFDAAELLWANTTDSELPAGTYNLTGYKSTYDQSTTEDGTFQITTTKAIPVGGGFRHSQIGAWRSGGAYSKDTVLSGKWTTYDASGNVLESNLATTEGMDGTSLGTYSVAQTNIINTIGSFNSTHRQIYGSNNWAESAIRQWINSDKDASAWWSKQTIFDLKPSYIGTKGYIADLDTEFVSVLGEVDNITKHNTVFEIGGTRGGSYTTRDKFFLLSRDELGYGIESGIAEGSVLEFYENATNTDRIKYDVSAKTTARFWWMRSPNSWVAGHARLVTTAGAINSYLAYDGYGAAPACIIY